MKKLIYIIIISLLLSAFSGCSLSGMVYENYHELEQLRLVEVMGIDRSDEGTVLSVAAGPGVGENTALILMHAQAPSITDAVETLQSYSASEDLFYSHAQYLIFGEEAARTGLSHYLDYVDRSPGIRMGLSVYVVRGGTAQELVEGTGGETYDVSNVLSSLERDAEKRGQIFLTTCRDLARKLARSGAGLAVALEICDMEKVSSEAEGEGKTAVPVGFCVIRDDKAVGWITGEPAAACALLTNQSAALPIALSDGQDGETTVTLTGSKCEITPVWENGVPTRFDVSFKLSGAIVELDHPLSVLDTGSPELLAGRLEETVCEWSRQVLEHSQELDADFLGLGVLAQIAEPKLFRQLGGSWPEQFSRAEFSISAQAVIERSYDLTVPAQTEGKETR